MSNVYGVAHFAKQNAVPQVEWKNIDIIGQYIDNLNKQKQLEMMDKSYELAKDQAAFAREKFGYDQERDKVKDGQWDKQFEYNKFNDAENRKANFDLEAVRNRNALGQIAARNNFYKSAENRELQNLIDIFTTEAQIQAEDINGLQGQVQKSYYDDNYTTGDKFAEELKASRSKFKNTFGFDVEELDKILKDLVLTTKYAKFFTSRKVSPQNQEF